MLEGWRKLAWTFAVGLCLQCTEDEPRRGQIMVVLQTDMSIPKGVDRIRLQVIQEGNFRHDQTYTVKPDGTTALPASLAIVAGEQPNDTVEVRVLGLRGSEGRVLSKVITTVPRSRIAVLRVPIQWLCVGELNQIDEDTYESTCDSVDDQEYACVAGTCQPVNIDPQVLSAYNPSEVYGGGEAPEDPLGQCFDTELCFESGIDMLPDRNCNLQVDVPRNRELNIALKLPGLADDPEAEAGICGESGCYVPLDRDPTYGWTTTDSDSSTDGEGGAAGESSASGEAGAAAQPSAGTQRLAVSLPVAVCDRIDEQRIEAVRVSTNCQTKTPQYPTCGPWSSVGEALVVQGESAGTNTSSTTGSAMMGSPSGSVTGGVATTGAAASTTGAGGASSTAVSTDGSAMGSGGDANPTTGAIGSSTLGGVAVTGTTGTGTSEGTGGDANQRFCPVVAEPPSGAAPLIDDFQDGDHFVLANENRNGHWAQINDGSVAGFQSTLPLLDMPTEDGMLHSSGSGFSDWGAGVIVIPLVDPNDSSQAACAYDASVYSGVQFTLNSDVDIRFQISLSTTDWDYNGGTCTSLCDDHYSFVIPAGDYTLYQVSFSSLAQRGIGTAVQWDPSQLHSIGWITDGAVDSFAFSLDDVSFYQGAD